MWDERKVALRDASGKLCEPAEPGLHLIMAADLMAAVTVPRDWGPWQLSTRWLVLKMAIPPWYEVDLERCRTAAGMADMVFQVQAKLWADDGVTAGLIRALGDVLNPQGSMCGAGRDEKISHQRLQEMVKAADRRREEGFRVYGNPPRYDRES